MKKNKEKIIPLIVFSMTFVVFIVVFALLNNSSKEEYSCYDAVNDKTYTFKTKEEMHKFCDNLEDNEDQILDSYDIYQDLIDADTSGFTFYPYVNDDNKLSIIIAISDCNNQSLAKANAEKWFGDHSYDISEYTIEYEYPCLVE